jgi:predicted DNA-binding protein (UPF0278 family)
MNTDFQDELARAYARLSSLQQNLNKVKESIISETYINEYHTILNKLKNIGFEVSDFYIPTTVIKEYRDYTEEKDVEKTYFLIKIDAVLNYFHIVTSPEPKKIGFKKPEY